MSTKKKILIGIGIFILIYFVFLISSIMNSGVGDESSQSINDTKPKKYMSGLENAEMFDEMLAN